MNILPFYKRFKAEILIKNRFFLEAAILCLVFVWQPSIANVLSEFVNMEKIGHHYVIQYFYLKGLGPTNIKAELDSSLGESTISFTTRMYWVARFKQGRASF